ncbi:MAG: hypothetical protein HS132_07075 [Planctomycetia bacterium]|nr:hypothetical protein [Planctomycetia bacterium]
MQRRTVTGILWQLPGVANHQRISGGARQMGYEYIALNPTSSLKSTTKILIVLA